MNAGYPPPGHRAAGSGSAPGARVLSGLACLSSVAAAVLLAMWLADSCPAAGWVALGLTVAIPMLFTASARLRAAAEEGRDA